LTTKNTKSTLAAADIIHQGWLWVAGGPEPRNDRLGHQHFIREYRRPMIRVSRPYAESAKSHVGAARHWVKTVKHGQAAKDSVRLHPRDLGRPHHERTLADANNIRHGRILSAGGPEPRKIRLDSHQSNRESPRVMIQVGRALQKHGQISRRGGSPLG
jgi:hypothetical protein